MRPVPAFTRRTFLFLGAAGSAFPSTSSKNRVFPSDWRRYPDPTTEFEVYRLTDPSYASWLPPAYSGGIAGRGRFLLFACDRSGSPQAFRMDLKTGECRQLTEAQGLDAASLTLLRNERSFCYCDGPSVRRVLLPNLREREIYRVPDGWQRCDGISVSDDGRHLVFGERRDGRSRLQLLRIDNGDARTIAEADWELSHPLVRPRRDQVLYRQGEEAVWLVNFDGQQNRRLRLVDGRIGAAAWAPDGKTVLYLSFPSDPKQLNVLRECTPDQNEDKLLAKTSQFVNFGFNGNSSVFVGASRNQAAPTVLLLLRVTRREMTLCEHSTTDPAFASPRFSPDSRFVYFASDRHGKPAIYRINVEKLVENTDWQS